MIKGGNIRNVYSDDVVILDGSRSSDPNEPPNEQNHLTYVWQCDLLETVCNAVVSKGTLYLIHFCSCLLDSWTLILFTEA